MPSPALSIPWQAFHVHKRHNAPDEYEDAFAGDGVKGRFAVADGASESSFVAQWAKLLAKGFVAAGRRPWLNLDWLEATRRQWAADVDDKPLPWYAEEKREQGAYATLLGVAFRRTRTPVDTLVWHAVAVGDSCLIRVRGGEARQSFPLTRAGEFGNQPPLLGSRGRPTDTPQQAIRRDSGIWLPGDRFLLMTDALAEWMLRRSEQNQQPAFEIERLLSENRPRDAFAGWVEERRDKQNLRNDDVTLLVIDPEIAEGGRLA